MRKSIPALLLIIIIASCGGNDTSSGKRIISVSIAPFKYFVREIAGNTFEVNIMVPAGSNPHIYEPYPDQIRKLSESEAYISDGFLGFELTWLDRFYEMNRDMKKLSLGTSIDPIAVNQHEREGHVESADPHYWVSPTCAFGIALSLKNFLSAFDPEHKELFEHNYSNLYVKIQTADSLAKKLSSAGKQRAFMIYHPNLAYLARDYGLKEIPVEFEGKEPSPGRMKYLIDIAKQENLKIILVQKEYDTKNARAIANETGAKVVIIDPLSENWFASVTEIINNLEQGFAERVN